MKSFKKQSKWKISDIITLISFSSFFFFCWGNRFSQIKIKTFKCDEKAEHIYEY